MNHVLNAFVLAVFFAPMALLVAANLLAYRPARGGDGILGLAAVPAAAQPPFPAAAASPAEEAFEELRRAA
ncbi:MAG TPA: hypothetical protein VEG27_12310 [Usitatibacter sp.]|nr:hypothetical protein [Usitatibacter sp.]